jgi:hypothetical protein
VHARGILPRRFRQHPPKFIRRERQNRRHELRQRHENLIQRRLRAAPLVRILMKSVQAVFQNVQIDRAQVHRTEVVQRVEDGVKLVGLVGVPDFRNQFAKPQQRPPVQLGQLLIRYAVLRRIEIVEVTQQEPAGVADLAIGLDQVVQNLL